MSRVVHLHLATMLKRYILNTGTFAGNICWLRYLLTIWPLTNCQCIFIYCSRSRLETSKKNWQIQHLNIRQQNSFYQDQRELHYLQSLLIILQVHLGFVFAFFSPVSTEELLPTEPDRTQKMGSILGPQFFGGPTFFGMQTFLVAEILPYEGSYKLLALLFSPPWEGWSVLAG